jgi:gamma-polyglutamate biosynthesis protein CapA
MKIILLGDIAFYGKYSISENPNVLEYFREVSQFLKQYDYVVGNLEAPFVEDMRPYGAKSAYIKSDPINVEILNFLNINAVNLANNHIYDYGEEGYLLTKKILNDHQIQYFGIEDQQILLDDGENKIALHGYCGYSTNPMGMYKEEKKYGVNELSIPSVEENLKKNLELGYFNIISMHGGQEHVNYPSCEDIRMARQFAKICPYVYYGHHPHVMQGMEECNDALIAHSLGNFCFDDVYTDKSKDPLIKQSENNKTAFMLELEFENNMLINYKTIPIYLSESSLIVNQAGVLKKLDVYSKKLSEDKDKYTKERNKLIAEYINGRKKMRNLKWLIKRLNFKSIIIILMSRYNSRKNKQNITDFLVDSK